MIQAENSGLRTMNFKSPRGQKILDGNFRPKKAGGHFTTGDCKKINPLKVKTPWQGRTIFTRKGIFKQYFISIPTCRHFFY